MEELKTIATPFSIVSLPAEKLTKEDKKLLDAEISLKKMYCCQQKLFTLTNMLSAGVMRDEGDFVPSIENPKDRFEIIQKILQLVDEF